MTEYLNGKPFSVQQRGRDPATCTHGWRNTRGVCVFCGDVATIAEQIASVTAWAEAHGGGLTSKTFPDRSAEHP